MLRRIRSAAIGTAAVLFVSFSANAQQVLYGATGSNGAAALLFTVNPATGASTPVGPILIGATPICMTGLAVHPTTGVMYGIVSNNCANNPRGFVSINPATGAATLIATMATPGSDLAFDASGTLFVWQSSASRLATINLATGGATALGASGIPGTTGGGLAINGTAFVAATTATGTLDTVNTATGAGTTGPALTGAPQTSSMNAMTFNAAGTLFAVNSDNGGPTVTNLVAINTATGVVTNIGSLPSNTDALAFAPLAVGPLPQAPTLSNEMLALTIILLGAAGMVAARRRR
jgi:hypothetical protein